MKQHMQIIEIVNDLKLDSALMDVFRKDWETSESSFPEMCPRFLEPGEYRASLEWVGFERGILPRLDSLSGKILKSPSLLHLAWHCYRKLFFYEDNSLLKWPLFEKTLGGDGHLFYFLVALGMVPLIKGKYKEISLPEQFAKDACKILRVAFMAGSGHRNTHDFDTKFLSWIRNYTEGSIFRIGRFEYMLRKMKWYNIEVYRDRDSGRIIALAGDNCYFDGNGYILYPDEDKGKAEFTSEIIRRGSYVAGFPIDPSTGTAVNRLVKLAAGKWERRLGGDDTVLDMHIPGGEKMPLGACGASFAKAFDFYGRYFPAEKITAIASVSWIFYRHYENVLPHSNLAAFMRELYLFPYPSSGRDGVSFIFKSDEGDIAGYPSGNTIQRVMVDVFKSGGRLRRGGMFYLPEHMSLFGRQPYRSILKVSDYER